MKLNSFISKLYCLSESMNILCNDLGLNKSDLTNCKTISVFRLRNIVYSIFASTWLILLISPTCLFVLI